VESGQRRGGVDSVKGEIRSVERGVEKVESVQGEIRSVERENIG